MKIRYMQFHDGESYLVYGVAYEDATGSMLYKRGWAQARPVPVALLDLPLNMPVARPFAWSAMISVPDEFRAAPHRLIEHELLLARTLGDADFFLALTLAADSLGKAAQPELRPAPDSRPALGNY